MNQHTILIVEDNHENYLLLNEILSMRNYHILHAEHGALAIDFIKNYPQISLVLMDLKMPKMNGYETTRKIKQLRPDLPIIAQTANFMNNETFEAMNAGCTSYITKPINFQELFAQIDEALIESTELF